MTKYLVHGIGYYTATVEVEANNPEEAEQLAEQLFPGPSLCHCCSKDFNLGDIENIEVEERN